MEDREAAEARPEGLHEEEAAQRMADMGEVARQLKQIAVHFQDTRNEMHTFSCNFDEGVYRFSQGDL